MTFQTNQKKTILKNGITLLTDQMPQNASTAISFYILKGARDESPDESGMTHFCEHAVFKGTPSYTKNTLAETLDMMGGKYNAYTANERVCIYNIVPSIYVSQCLEIFCDMVNNSLFDEKEIDLEREVILNELRMGLEIPQNRINDEFDEKSFAGTQLSPPIIGTVESVSGFTADQLRDYYHQAFIAENIIVSIAGNFNENEVLTLLENTEFRHGTPPIRKDLMPSPEHSVGWTIMPSEQLHIIAGNSRLRLTFNEHRLIRILDSIMGDNMSSRLFQRIREDLGLCYSVHTSTAAYTFETQFCINLSIAARNLKKTVNAISDIITDIKHNGITESELNRAKQAIINEVYLSFDKAQLRAARMVSQLVKYGRFIPFDETIAGYNAITVDDVNAFVHKVFDIDKWYTHLLYRKECDMPAWKF
ncbi:MAG: insulinase family protein [Spirochaetales bacterium]|nr:insulinase family protein [Spirochaetales bacterium]